MLNSTENVTELNYVTEAAALYILYSEALFKLPIYFQINEFGTNHHSNILEGSRTFCNS